MPEGPGFFYSAFVFIVSLSVLVFIHEWGHYRMAKAFGVKILSFSIGFGKELFGYTDKAGVRWKISALPLGGYVKFAGDANAASAPDLEAIKQSPEEEQGAYFHNKPLWQRALIVAAGPAVNLIVPIFVFAALAFTYGVVISPPIVDYVQEGSAAESAKLQAGDKIISIDGRAIDRFNHIKRVVELNPGQVMSFKVEREGSTVVVPVTVGTRTVEDRFGNSYPIGMLGIASEQAERVEMGFVRSLEEGVLRTGETIATIGSVARQLVLGLRSVKEVAGPIRIADMTGTVARRGLDQLILFLAMISINLGLVNLLPIPGLDGGHLMLYTVEALKGGPLNEGILEAGYRLGIGLLMVFMVFVFWNDLQSVAL